jgi:hypothetical protein
MAGFFCRRDQAGEERWALDINGKGDKTRIVPATNELMVELARYRREKGLAPLPLPSEAPPLLRPISDRKEPMTRGGECQALADRIEQASAHWLWHTAGAHISIFPGCGEPVSTSTIFAIAVPFPQDNSFIQGTIMELKLACQHLQLPGILTR